MCAFHDVKHFSTTANHLQTDSQDKRFNETVLMRLQNYTAEY